MPFSRNKFVSKINWILDINQLIAKAKTAVVVKKRPIAAVAVNSDKSIIKNNFGNHNFLLELKLYYKLLLYNKFDFIEFFKSQKKRPHTCEAGWWGTLFLNQFL